MTVFTRSRFAYCTSTRVAGGRVVFDERLPYTYRAHPDNRLHEVLQNDTLSLLAGSYFTPLPRACGYWWAIAEFQPEPIINPLVPLHQQRTRIVIPSLRVLTDIILQPRRQS
jgi:hypothetical protein